MVCQILDHHLDSTKLPYTVKFEVQTHITDTKVANVSSGFSRVNLIDIQLNEVKLFNSISPSQMAQNQKRDTQLSLVYEYVANNHKPKLSDIHHVWSKPIRWLFLQYDWLSLIWGVLHHQTFKDENEVQQLIFPISLCDKVLHSLHNDKGHQSLQHVFDLLHFKVYWPTIFADTDCWLSQCEWCLVAKGDYTEPKTLQGSLVAHQPLELLCIIFTKAYIAKRGKENILVLTDVFFKYSQAFVTSHQKSLTIAKLLVEKWFSVFVIPSQIHSNQGKSFDNEIISHLCNMYG